MKATLAWIFFLGASFASRFVDLLADAIADSAREKEMAVYHSSSC